MRTKLVNQMIVIVLMMEKEDMWCKTDKPNVKHFLSSTTVCCWSG
jgi:hypothetical protein